MSFYSCYQLTTRDKKVYDIMTMLIMQERLKELFKNPYFMIVVVYLFTHFFMIVLSGVWWDDWTFMFGNTDYVNTVASESGRPEWKILIPFCLSLTNNGRILIFFLYLCISIFVYRVLLYSDIFDEKESLYVAMLFTIIPVNDARILVSNFTYTVGLFFFYLAFMLFVQWNKMENTKKKNAFRIILLCLFFISFILNSILAYFYIVFAYLFVLEMKKSKEKNVIKRSLLSVKNVLSRYPDFFLMPLIYYFINKTFFPTYGHVFGNYNAVTINGLLKSFSYIPKAVAKVFINVFDWWIKSINLVVVLLALLSCVVIFINDKSDDKKTTITKTAEYLIYGLFVLIVGLVPYVMVRGRAIDTFGVKGRDAVLVPLGFAIMIFSFLTVIKNKYRKTLLTLLIVLGVVGFNNSYIEWQKDYYYQLSLENLLNNNVVRNNDTFFLTEINETEIEAQRYYSLNANAKNVFGNETRFFIPKVSNLYLLESEEEMKIAKEELEYSHVMKDYNPDDLYFDAVLNFSCNLSDEDVVLLKYYELFNYEEFEKIIKSIGSLDIYLVDKDFTAKMFKEYEKGHLKNDEDVLQLVLSYAR